MIYLLKIITTIALIMIIYQDNRDQEFWLFLLPLAGLAGGALFFVETKSLVFLKELAVNITIVTTILVGIYSYAFLIMKKRLLMVLALGDILFFFVFAMFFPTVHFINFFIFSILFSLSFHFLKKIIGSFPSDKIPLAGYMSIFILALFFCHWAGYFKDLYII